MCWALYYSPHSAYSNNTCLEKALHFRLQRPVNRKSIMMTIGKIGRLPGRSGRPVNMPRKCLLFSFWGCAVWTVWHADEQGNQALHHSIINRHPLPIRLGSCVNAAVKIICSGGPCWCKLAQVALLSCSAACPALGATVAVTLSADYRASVFLTEASCSFALLTRYKALQHVRDVPMEYAALDSSVSASVMGMKEPIDLA